MRKLLSILASVSIAASSSAGVVACADNTVKNDSANSYVNNDLQDILSASLAKAKGIIFDNEYGISQSYTSNYFSHMSLKSAGITESQSDKNDNDKTVEDLVQRYYGSTPTADNGHENNIALGGVNGQQAGFQYIISTLLDKTVNSPVLKNFVLRNFQNIMNALALTKNNANTKAIDDANKQAYSLGIGSKWLPNMILSTITGAMNKYSTTAGIGTYIQKVNVAIDKVLLQGSKLNNTLNGLFKNSTVRLIREVLKDIGDANAKDKVNNLNKVIYENKPFTLPDFSKKDTPAPVPNKKAVLDDNGGSDTTTSPTYTPSVDAEMKSVPVANVKDEILASADRILTIIFTKLDMGTSSDDKGNKANKLADANTPKPLTYTKGKGEWTSAPDATDYKSWDADLVNRLSAIISALMNGKKDQLKVSLNQADIMGIVVEGIRIFTVLNSAFSIFDGVKDVNVTSSKNLFSNSESNYNFLNNAMMVQDSKTKVWNFVNDKDSTADSDTAMHLWNNKLTLADTPYLLSNKTLNAIKPTTQDDSTDGGSTGGNDTDDSGEPININYLISNLNYYLGELDNKDGTGAYRMQQFLFLLLNDPSGRRDLKKNDGSMVPAEDDGTWNDKNSSLMNFVLNVGMKVFTGYADAKVAANPNDKTWVPIDNALKSIAADPSVLPHVENLLLKPVLLGLINGDDFEHIYNILVNGAALVINKVPQVEDAIAPFKKLIDEVMNSLKRLVNNKEFATDTIHSLFTVDFRPIIQGISLTPVTIAGKTINPQDIMNMLFSAGAPVNLTTILSMPVNKILSILNVPGFKGGKILPIADYFTTQSVPSLMRTMDDLLNNVDHKSITKTNKYLVYKSDGTVDWLHSLKSRDLDLDAIYGLYDSIVGDNPDGSDNIFSKALGIVNIGAPIESSDSSNSIATKLTDANGTVSLDTQSIINDAISKGQIVNISLNPSTFLSVIGAVPPGTKPDDSGKDKQPAQAFDDSGTKPDNGGGSKDGGDTPTPQQPIKYLDHGFAGSLYRLVLPLVDSTAPEDPSNGNDFLMKDDYLNIDLLNDGYSKFITVLQELNTTGNYQVMMDAINNYKNSFVFSYDKKNIGYFTNHRNLIKSLQFNVKFENYITGETHYYTFRVSRDSNIIGFNVDQITSTKADE